jgi:hypothetical protein
MNDLSEDSYLEALTEEREMALGFGAEHLTQKKNEFREQLEKFRNANRSGKRKLFWKCQKRIACLAL